MAKKKINIQEIYTVTGNLLLEKGYAGFHFKLVSDRLNVSRSTIYEYFSNKDELISSLMAHLMENMMQEIDGFQQVESPMEEMRKIFDLFRKYSHIHQILQNAPYVNVEGSPTVQQSLHSLRSQHQTLKQLLTRIVDACKERSLLRSDIPSSLITTILFTSVQIPGSSTIAEQEWNDLIFMVLLEGFGAENGHKPATS